LLVNILLGAVFVVLLDVLFEKMFGAVFELAPVLLKRLGPSVVIPFDVLFCVLPKSELLFPVLVLNPPIIPVGGLVLDDKLLVAGGLLDIFPPNNALLVVGPVVLLVERGLEGDVFVLLNMANIYNSQLV
jgi:hypothetical protein